MAGPQQRLPILEAIRDYVGVRRLHMPGHKGGGAVAAPYLEYLGRRLFEADVVSAEGLDDLHSPSGCIAEAQRLAAEAWGADHSLFLVNGTSCGLHGLILALCRPGDKLIVPRNAHRSVVGGLILSGAYPVYLEPDFDRSFGLPLGIAPEAVAGALSLHPDAKGVLVVSPTYHGALSDIRKIAEITHSYGLPLLVDEAHGAHLGFHPELPDSALSQGADGVAQGIHKTAGSLTQTSILHLKGTRVPVDRVRAVLRLLQTTSPSYILMSSLDAARYLLVNHGRDLLDGVLSLSRRVTGAVEALGAVRCLHVHAAGGPAGFDPTRITVNVSRAGLTGLEVERALRREFGLQVELSDFANVVLLLSLGDSPEAVEAFLAGLERIAAESSAGRRGSPSAPRSAGRALLPPTPPTVLSPAVAFRGRTRRVPLDRAVGCVSAEMIAAYPPGIPAIYPGERVTEEVVAYLSEAKRAGMHLQGHQSPGLDFLQVIDQD